MKRGHLERIVKEMNEDADKRPTTILTTKSGKQYEYTKFTVDICESPSSGLPPLIIVDSPLQKLYIELDSIESFEIHKPYK